MLAIKNNIMAGNAARHLGAAYDSLAKSVERLSSGLRINGARDDAAGLAVRELIRADIATLQQGARNAQDGISMLQTMEGAMAVMDENLIRMQELAEQAATGAYSAEQREIMNAEFAEMAAEIERIANNTKFNNISLLNEAPTATNDVKIHVGTTETIDIDKVDMTKAGLNIETGDGGWEILSDPATGVAAVTDTFLSVADADADADGVVWTIQFTAADAADNEAAITTTFAGGASSTVNYTLAQVVSMLNESSQALGYASDGTNQAYDVAEAVLDETSGKYVLKLKSRTALATGVNINSALTTGGDAVTVTGMTTTEVGDIEGDFADTGSASAGLNIKTVEAATTAMTTITAAINTKDTARAAFGYKMNRLESTISILDIQSENLMAAESRISDVDVATEMAALTRTQVLAQAGVSMLAQANTMPQMALSLLR